MLSIEKLESFGNRKLFYIDSFDKKQRRRSKSNPDEVINVNFIENIEYTIQNSTFYIAHNFAFIWIQNYCNELFHFTVFYLLLSSFSNRLRSVYRMNDSNANVWVCMIIFFVRLRLYHILYIYIFMCVIRKQKII